MHVTELLKLKKPSVFLDAAQMQTQLMNRLRLESSHREASAVAQAMRNTYFGSGTRTTGAGEVPPGGTSAFLLIRYRAVAGAQMAH